MIYIVIFCLLAFIGLFEFVRISRLEKELISCILVLLLIFFAGLRFETGSDWENYTPSFERTPTLNHFFFSGYKFEYEIGYEFLCSLVKTFGGTVQTIFFIVPLFNVSATFLILRKYTPYILITLFCFYCTFYTQFNFAVIRQGIAFPFFLCGLQYLFKRNFWHYAGCIVVASVFHYSCIVFMLLYLIPFHKTIGTKKALLFFLIGFIWMQFFSIKAILNIGLAAGIFPPYVNAKLINYLLDSQYNVVRGFSMGFFLKTGIFLFALYHRDKLRIRIKHFDFIFNFFLFYCFLWMVLNGFDVILNRYSLYFQFAQDLVLVYFIIILRERVLKLSFYAGLVIINAYFFSVILRSYYEAYVPYKTIIGK